MAVDIGPKIGIEGEKEFRKNLNDINQQIRTLGSEMKAVASEFLDANDNEEKLAEQTKVLNKQIRAQEDKLGELNKALDFAVEAYGDADSRTQKWRQAVYDATTDLNKMKSQLKKAEQGIDDFGDAADDSSDSLGDFANVLKTGLGAGAVGVVINSVKDLAGAMMSIVDDSMETRKNMGMLRVSSEAAGYSAEETMEVYKRFYAVTGDQDTAMNATANLQALELGQEDLMKMTELAIGAWVKYGGSIPLDSLAESINETVQAGEVTGNFADVLGFAGDNQDDFNERLQTSADKGDRANEVLKTMSDQGLAELATAYSEVNSDIEDANIAQGEWDEAMAELGSVLSPAKDQLVEFGTNAIQFVTDKLKDAIDWWNKFYQTANVEAGKMIDEEKANFGSGVSATMTTPAGASAFNTVGADAANKGETLIVEAPVIVGGQTVARNQYKYNLNEANRRGQSLVK